MIQEDVELMTATIKEFLFRAAMMVRPYFHKKCKKAYWRYCMCIVYIIFIVYIYVCILNILLFVHHVQVGKEDEEGDGDGRVGLMVKSY